VNAPSLRSPEPVDEDFERFLVHDRFEILSILRVLQSEIEPVTLNVDGEGFTLTVLLAINPEFEEVVFDCGSDPEGNRRILRAERVTMVANTGGIKVQFSAKGADATVFEGRPALRMRLPDILLRLQRRDYYRIPGSLACDVAVDFEGKVRVLALRVVDLSLGGIALLADGAPTAFEVGDILRNCSIALGKLGRLAFDLRIQNKCQARTRSDLRQLRIGCGFENLSQPMGMLLSRYIGQQERERRVSA